LSDAAPNGIRPLRLELAASPGLAVAIVAVHAAAGGSFLTVLPGWQGLALCALTTALGCAAAWDRALLRAPRSAKAIEIARDGAAKCLFADGGSASLRPLGGSAVTRYWVALRLRGPGRGSLFIAKGMLAPQALRLLRLWALWGRLPVPPFWQGTPGAG